jgi:HEAT repeat protein
VRWWDLRQLKSSSPARRARAAAAFGQSEDVDVLDVLLPLSEDAAPEVRASAREAVASIRERALRRLLPLMLEPERREATMKALGQIDKKWRRSNAARDAVGAFVGVLETGDRQARCKATGALAALHARAGVDALVSALNGDDRFVSHSATRALGEIRDTRAIEPLLGYVVATRDGLERQAAIDALAQIDVKWTQSELARSMIARLVTLLVDPDDDRRGTATSLLQMIDPQWAGSDHARAAVPELIRALAGGPPFSRRVAAALLGQIGDLRAAEPLIEALAGADWDVVRYAAAALGALGDRRAVEPLLDLIGRVRAPETFRAAAESLGRLGDRGAVGPLVDLIRSSEDWQRPAIMKALDALSADWQRLVPPDLVIDTLVSRLGSPDQDAIQSLGRIGPAAVERLLDTLRGDASFARGQAAQALALIDDPRVLPALADTYERHLRHEDGGWLHSALIAVGGSAADVFIKRTLDPDSVWGAVSSLRALLESDSARVSEGALRVLAALDGLSGTTGVTHDDGTFWPTGKERIDTSDVRRLAGQELERRTNR